MSNNLTMYFKYRSEQRKFLEKSRAKLFPNRKKTNWSQIDIGMWMQIVVAIAVFVSVPFVVFFVFDWGWFASFVSFFFLAALSMVATAFLEDQY